jgi:predicted RNase H-like HicB family nuclease
MQKDNYTFPCVFIYEESGISIYFPDLDGCISYGENEEDAIASAKECLSLHLYGMEEDNEIIPKASKLKDIKVEEGECSLIIEVFMPVLRARQENTIVKKTLTIPKWINIEAERQGVNFSQILQKALKEYLHIDA